MSILNQPNKIAQSVVSNGLTTGNQVQNPNNLLNTTDDTALFGATSDVIIGNFPFNLPLDAVIVGISGILKARIDNNSIPSGSITPVLVDSTSGVNVYFPGAAVTGLSDVLEEYEIGGAYDIWGNVSWTPAKINNLRLQLIANSSLEVAWASLTVFYYIPQVTPTPPAFELPGCEDCDSTIQALPFELAEPWLANQDTLVLKSFSLPDGTPITLSMLGECGGTINATVDPDLRREDGDNFIENFNIDASIASITDLPNGTVSIDLGNINRRGLGFSTPYGHDTDNISEHAAGAVVIITNNGPWNSKLLKRCHIGTLVSAPITVEDEGDVVAVATETFNFIGDNVQAEQDNVDPRKANITVIASPTNVQPTEEDTATGTNNTTPSTTLTVPLTIVNANYLRVAVITEDETISDVTYDGVSMSFIGEQVNPGVNLKVALYGLINPNVGANDVVVTMATSRIITAIATSWLDVDTTSPVDGVSAGAIGSSNAPTDSATTTTENTVMQDVVGTTNNPTTFSQSGLWSIRGAVTTGIRPGASSSRRVLAPQLVSDTYGLSLSTGWAMIMAGIRGIASATPGSGVQSVTGEAVDNTDPANPVITTPKNNIAAVAPTGSNDNTEGYSIGSEWFNSVSNTLYIALSVGTGTAVWDAVSPGAGASLTLQKDGVTVQTAVSNINVTGNANVTTPGVGQIDIEILGGAGNGGTKIAIDTTQVVVPSNTTVDAYTIPIPGGTLSTNNGIYFKAIISTIDIDANNTFNIKYGGTTVAVLGPIVGSGASIATIEGYILADTATNAQKASATALSETNSNIFIDNNGVAAVDSTTDQNLVIEVVTAVGGGVTLESIVVQKISGSGGGVIEEFTAAQAINTGDVVGVSAIDADNVALANWYSKSVSIDGTANGMRRAAYIGSNRYAVVYDAGGTGTGGVAIVEIDRDTMTVATLYSNGSILGAVDSIYVCSLGTVDKFLISYTEDGVNDGKVQVCEWTGATVNQGTPVTVQGGGDWTGGYSCNMGTDRAAVIFQDQPGNQNSVFMVTVSGTVPTAAANATFGDANFSDTFLDLCRIDTEKFVIVSQSNRARVYEFTSPSTLTAGTILTITTGGTIWVRSAVDGKFMIMSTGNNNLAYCSVSGTTITVEDNATTPNSTNGSLMVIDATTFYVYQSNNTIQTSGVYEFSISGGNTIDVPILIASRVLPTSGGQLLDMTTQGYFVILDNAPTTTYFIQGMSGMFTGIAQNTVARGASVQVLISGIDTNQTGKSPGTIYEVADGVLTATLDITVPYKVIGKSATEVII